MDDTGLQDDWLHFNGIDGATGEGLLPPMRSDQFAACLQGEPPPEQLAELQQHLKAKQGDHFGVKEGVDARRLDQAGWGVVFAQVADPAIAEVLRPLLDLRRQQAGQRMRVFQGDDGLRRGESKAEFLARHGMGPGPADPDRLPYYLMLVGSPRDIPWRFQSQLDVQYAVGRLWFDSLQGYANYARSVVAAETGPLRLARRAAFFGVANEGDRATAMSSTQLINPVFNALRSSRPDWDMVAHVGAAADKARLARLLGGSDTPALLVSASHGMSFPAGDPRQAGQQGALLCQDWPGPQAWQGRGAIPDAFYFSGDDLAADAGLHGLMAMHFGCWGAGTPQDDDFARLARKAQRTLAPAPFVAGLPTRLLGHPAGGALAVIGHVDRSWGYAFSWPGAGAQTTVFESTLARLLDGCPVGHAMEFFNERYAELASDLSVMLEDIEFGLPADPAKLTGLWTANSDARSCIVLGDPAVRLPVAAAGTAAADRTLWLGSPQTEAVAHVALPPSVAAADPTALADAPGLPDSPPVATAAPDLAEAALMPSFGLDDAAGPAGSDAPADAAAEPDDSVQFSAYHPSALRPGSWHRLLVYAHLDSALAAVAADAGQVLGTEAAAYRAQQVSASLGLVPGTLVTLVPQGAGLAFDPPRSELRWGGRWQRADFQLCATGERAGHVVTAAVACYVGPLLVAEVRLPMVVLTDSASPQDNPADGGAEPGFRPVEPVTEQRQTARLYQAIFASYSHADTAIVEAVEKAYAALGMDYLRDVMTLKSGQSWSDELLRMIDRADIFQLFWSQSASRSAYVEQEWRHALDRAQAKGPAFIRPVYWEPQIAPVPAPLAALHFAPVDFAGLAAAPAASTDLAIAPTPPAAVPSPVSLPLAMPTADADLTRLTVSTYALDASADAAAISGRRLQAVTRIALDGDVETELVPPLSAADERCLALHQDLVKEALRVRLAYLELLARGARS